MGKELKILSLIAVIVIIGIVYLQIRPIVRGNRVESGDLFTVLVATVESTLKQFEPIPGYDKLSDIQVRKFKKQMGSCLALVLMQFTLDKDFEYMTLKEKLLSFEKLLTTTYKDQFNQAIVDCYYKLDQDILNTFPIRWGK